MSVDGFIRGRGRPDIATIRNCDRPNSRPAAMDKGWTCSDLP